MHDVIIVIPAFRPTEGLGPLLEALAADGLRVVLVDDGSGPDFEALFAQCEGLGNVDLVRHAANQGKGAALRTGFNHALLRWPDLRAIVTADADGQHLPVDVARVASHAAANPKSLVLGVRTFGESVPLRSRFGNHLTCTLFGLLYGVKLNDTQTGLRGIPQSLAVAMLKSSASGYEFELDMLITARRMSLEIEQVPIQTVYLAGNASSHFNPLFDSMRVYLVLLRFSAVSIVTAICDNAVFIAGINMGFNPLAAQATGRVLAGLVNFRLNRRLVFRSGDEASLAWLRYAALVMANGMISYLSLMSLHAMFDIPLVPAKLAVETLLFLANFALQRDFVFRSAPANPAATDWTAHYRRTPWTAKLTRRYTTHQVLKAFRRAGLGKGTQTIAEFGGGNSCFLAAIRTRFQIHRYHVVDTNKLGLDLVRQQQLPGVVLHETDAREAALSSTADVVFSIGLIEHFDPEGTEAITAAHFRNARPGGWVLISYPSPTLLYRVTRWLLEAAGVWRFPDERPLQRHEVLKAAAKHGELVWEQTLWPLLLTQNMMLFRARH